ncbi:MAG: FMN-binding glutamate synthase family protein [Sulfobacillus acidophilus]|uniref:FMN-binding glutamate synthase family protein n=1 Tax=Sulfobacillus acidophilus TaxID=53633 RepID=A0A2T2WIK3_9FIRM|nr:MAG: FMN-binding glutamate synthase family protein [Sulfobacillus acidophilus]
MRVLYLAAIVALVMGALLLAIALGGWFLFRWAIARVEQGMSGSSRSSLLELFFGLQTIRLEELFLLLQRTAHAKPAQHPMGSPTRIHWLDEFTWDPATLDPPAISRRARVHLEVSLGPRALRPLTLAFPVVIAPMGYGIALNRVTKVALAQASALAGIATNSGEGPFLPAERAFAQCWILQYGRGPWDHQDETLRIADMVEIQVGQGSEAGTGIEKSIKRLPSRVRQAMDHPTRKFHIHGGFPWPLPAVIQRIRRINPEVPVGIKLPASNHLEQDLALMLQWGVDVITFDGNEAASSSSPAVISDHFGIATAEAIARAHRWLVLHKRRQDVSLIAAGGARSASDIATLLALGADTVAVGTAILFAATQNQVARVLPFYGPSRLVFAEPSLPRRQELNLDKAVESCLNWLKATQSELALIAQALGVDRIQAVSAHHLVARTDRAQHVLQLAQVQHERLAEWIGHVRLMTDHYATLIPILTQQWAQLSRWSF